MTNSNIDSPVIDDVRSSAVGLFPITLAELRSEMARPEGKNHFFVVAFNDDPRLTGLFAITEEIFPAGEPVTEVMWDPEDPMHPFLVMTVKARGETRSLLRLSREWHERVNELWPRHSGLLRLAVIPV